MTRLRTAIHQEYMWLQIIAWFFPNKEGKTIVLFIWLVQIKLSDYSASVYWMHKALFDSSACCLGMRHFVWMKNIKYSIKIKMKFKFH